MEREREAFFVGLRLRFGGLFSGWFSSDSLMNSVYNRYLVWGESAIIAITCLC